jgi:hypothetical protein
MRLMCSIVLGHATLGALLPFLWPIRITDHAG